MEASEKGERNQADGGGRLFSFLPVGRREHCKGRSGRLASERRDALRRDVRSRLRPQGVSDLRAILNYEASDAPVRRPLILGGWGNGCASLSRPSGRSALKLARGPIASPFCLGGQRRPALRSAGAFGRRAYRACVQSQLRSAGRKSQIRSDRPPCLSSADPGRAGVVRLLNPRPCGRQAGTQSRNRGGRRRFYLDMPRRAACK